MDPSSARKTFTTVIRLQIRSRLRSQPTENTPALVKPHRKNGSQCWLNVSYTFSFLPGKGQERESNLSGVSEAWWLPYSDIHTHIHSHPWVNRLPLASLVRFLTHSHRHPSMPRHSQCTNELSNDWHHAATLNGYWYSSKECQSE